MKRFFFTDRMLQMTAFLLVLAMGLISFVPRGEAAFISSEESFSAAVRSNDMATIRKVLENKMVTHRLQALGLSEQEISQRLDRLSDTEIHDLASNLDALMPAGGGEAVIILLLVAILVVLLFLHVTGKKVIIG